MDLSDFFRKIEIIARKQGRKEGKKELGEKIAIKMLKDGMSIENILIAYG